MLGRAAGRHGSCCGGPPGADCADYYKGKKPQRSHEKRQWQKEEHMIIPYEPPFREKFDFPPKDLIIRTQTNPYHVHATITHIPTGIVVHGYNDENAMSLHRARLNALRELKKQLEKLNSEEEPEEE
jgi:hypothetical protein